MNTEGSVDENRFGTLKADWVALHRRDDERLVEGWEASLKAMNAENERLRAAGRWQTGPADFLGVTRPDWQGADGRPMAAVGIGWSPSSVDFKPSSSWIGVWRGQRDDADPLVDHLRSSLTEIAAELKLTNRGDRQWPLYRYGPGPSGAHR